MRDVHEQQGNGHDYEFAGTRPHTASPTPPRRASRRRRIDGRRAKAIKSFWDNLPKPIKLFVQAFAILWLAGIAFDIYHGRFDSTQTLLNFCRGLFSIVGLW